jgi:hypothetical protein
MRKNNMGRRLNSLWMVINYRLSKWLISMKLHLKKILWKLKSK